jgi:hypothetical protein
MTGCDNTLPSDVEEVQNETSVQDEPAGVRNRRSQSLDSLNDNGTESDTVTSSTADVIVKEESSESEVDDIRPTADLSSSDTSSVVDESSQQVRIIPIRADSFKQAMQIEPIDCTRKQRISTLEDVFEDDNSANNDNTQSGQQPTSILRPSVTMRRSLKNSLSPASSSPDYRNKRLSRLFDDWDPSMLASVSTMQELFKSWPAFDDSPDMMATGRIIPIQRAQSNGPSVKRDESSEFGNKQNALPVFSSLNHSLSNCSSRSHRLYSAEPIMMSNKANKPLQTMRQVSVPVVQVLSNNDTSRSTSTSYSVPVKVISTNYPSVSTCNDVPVLVNSSVSVNSFPSATVSSSSSCASMNLSRNIPVRVVQSVSTVYSVPVLHSSISVGKSCAAGDCQTVRTSISHGQCDTQRGDATQNRHTDERVIPIARSQLVAVQTVQQSNGRNSGNLTDQFNESPASLSCESVCDGDLDEDPLKKMLQEMTVKHQTIRETVQKMNLKTSRSVDSLDGVSAPHKLAAQPASSSRDRNSCKPKPAAVVNPVAGDLIKKRLTMFEGENG